ncbi:GNAT family N-acetyltransferase [Granulosicoccus sp. 3-233]|uniref:GNAT family N-acetyltransferase n=1 Tax=Granulosicoccus sp. 3-233 TaxID=3417969 RepID=UPI003D333ECC
MKKFDIRTATTNDISVLRGFEQKLIALERKFDAELKSSGATYYDLEHLISDDDSYLVVAESSGEVIGSGYGQFRESKSCFDTGKHCYLGFIFVDDSCRGFGVAKRIMDAVCDWSEERGVNYFLLEVYSENETAISAYEKLGFKSLSVTMELRR